MTLQRWFAVLNLSLISMSSWASGDCSGDYSWLTDSRYGNKSVMSAKVVCKFWPVTNSEILAVTIKRAEGVDLEVMVIDPVTKEIVAENYQENALSDGAIRSSSLKIDTANYRLTNDVSAFGVRVRWNGSSQPNPYAAEALNLYRIREGELLKILDGLAVYEYSGEWDTHCAGEFVERNMIIVMNDSSIDGEVSDLFLKEKSKRIVQRGVSGECVSTSSNLQSKTYLIPFEHDHYKLGQELRVLD